MTTMQAQDDALYLSQDEVNHWPAMSLPRKHVCLKSPLRDAIEQSGQQNPLQIAGNHFAMGCVALEITQRCNLDCTACYLSDYSQAARDLPLDEIFRRIDLIAAHYGPKTNVQVTGGDPTLRKRDELVAIVRYLANKDLRPALFTNGIKATRGFLKELKEAGLKDVAFHVDMTQERKGYVSEADLNALRDQYIERARGLGLQIIFNTTIFEGNFKDIPMLADFFCRRAKDVHLASFQMIADTGRGVERQRVNAMTQEAVMAHIREGTGVDLSFDFPQIGHLECNRYAKCLVAGTERVSAISETDRAFFTRLLPFTRNIFLSRHKPVRSLFHLARKLANGNVMLLVALLAYGARKAWALRYGLLKTRARPDLITFYIHNFMHENALNRERCEACVFMTMTRDGPISMCVHNAKRDSFILQKIKRKDGTIWSPLGEDNTVHLGNLRPEQLKGRARARNISGVIGKIASERG